MLLQDARELFEGIGFDTIPLRPGGKEALLPGWQRRDIYRQWRSAPQDANLGLRAGGDAALAILDCDERERPGTFGNAQSWFASLGYLPGDYPVIQTASGVGRHIYATLAGGGLPGNYRNLSSEFGAGEFRYSSGAYVAAPPSRIEGGGAYLLIGGAYRQLPNITAADVLPILANQDTTPEPEQPKIPRRAAALLSGNAEIIAGYSSRSEAEQALILSLVNAGHDFESILALFLRNACAGKFAELRQKSEKNAARWLQRSFDEARQYAATHESKARQTAAAALDWAESTPWPGRTGAVDRLVFLAHCQIAHRAGKLDYAAGCRDLAELAAVTHPTASAATSRLITAGRLKLVTPSRVDCASVYRLAGQTLPLPKYYYVRKWKGLSHDAFRAPGWKTAGEVYQALTGQALTVEELAAVTGRHARTIKRALRRMAGLVDSVTGEVLAMVEQCGDKWQALPGVDLEQIAQVLGVAGAGARQKEKHKAERRAHRRALAMGRKVNQ